MNKDQNGFSLIEIGITLIALCALGTIGLFVYQSRPVGMVTTDTECFSISVPKDYKIKSTGTNCQFWATLGADTKNSQAYVAILPYKSKIGDLKEAEAVLVEDMGSIKKADGKTKIDGYDAVYVEGPSFEKYTTFIVALSPKSYSPSAANYTTNAFMINVAVPQDDQRMVKKITDSIEWH